MLIYILIDIEEYLLIYLYSVNTAEQVSHNLFVFFIYGSLCDNTSESLSCVFLCIAAAVGKHNCVIFEYLYECVSEGYGGSLPTTILHCGGFPWNPSTTYRATETLKM